VVVLGQILPNFAKFRQISPNFAKLGQIWAKRKRPQIFPQLIWQIRGVQKCKSQEREKKQNVLIKVGHGRKKFFIRFRHFYDCLIALFHSRQVEA
jgi:hypothetical protein